MFPFISLYKTQNDQGSYIFTTIRKRLSLFDVTKQRLLIVSIITRQITFVIHRSLLDMPTGQFNPETEF